MLEARVARRGWGRGPVIVPSHAEDRSPRRVSRETFELPGDRLRNAGVVWSRAQA
jgi:hypothetical protein